MAYALHKLSHTRLGGGDLIGGFNRTSSELLPLCPSVPGVVLLLSGLFDVPAAALLRALITKPERVDSGAFVSQVSMMLLQSAGDRGDRAKGAV